jgi:hypothetical protein
MTGEVPAVDEIPFSDREALQAWLLKNPGKATPLALERLLEHEGFGQVGVMPTKSSVECAVWRPREAEQNPKLTQYQVLVYHTPSLSRANLALALEVVRRFRIAKMRTK